MGPTTIMTGCFLIALGVIGFVPTQAMTAWIPAYFGFPLLVLGFLARQEKLRMHVMHGAVLVGLIGFIGAVVMIIRALTAPEIERPFAVAMQGCMALVCGVFVGLCVKSFIDARKQRKAAEAASNVGQPSGGLG